LKCLEPVETFCNKFEAEFKESQDSEGDSGKVAGAGKFYDLSVESEKGNAYAQA
jgi:hypothetical protein